MESGRDPTPPRVLLCPECQSELQDQTALFRHLADAHPALILGPPPKAARKPKGAAAKKKLTWKEEAKRALELADERRSKRGKAEAAPKPAAKKAAAPPAAPKAAAAAPPPPSPAAPTKPAAPPAPAPAPAPPPAAPVKCDGEHAWEPAGQSQFLQFERCADCGARRMTSRAARRPDAGEAAPEPRLPTLRRERGWKG